MLQKGKANVILDGQWGSTGKGKLAGYLAMEHDVDMAVCDFMSNAGHTYVYDNGVKVVTCQLPSSVVNTDTILVINAGSAITLERLFKEIDEHNCASRVFIHPHAAVITEEDREHEAKCLKRISSTLKGCGGSLARKVMRVAKLAKDEPKLAKFIAPTGEMTLQVLRSGGTVLVEGAQGFDLSLNHGYDYPYCTSRDVTTMSILNNAAIPPRYLGCVFGTLRTYPIRVGNMIEDGTMVGTSGPWHHDQKEISWEELAHSSGASDSIVERTTVTNKVRRVFTFSYSQVKRFIDVCEPDYLFVNFINHVNANDAGKRTLSDLSLSSRLFLEELDSKLEGWSRASGYRTNIRYIGTGAKHSDMITLEDTL